MNNLPAYLRPLQESYGTSVLGSGPSTPSQSVNFTSMLSAEASKAGLFGKEDTVAPSDKFRFLMVSTHCHQYTGYSKVSYGFVRELAKHDFLSVTHFGFQKQPAVPPLYRPYPPNIKVIDAAALEKPTPGGPPPQGFGYNALPDIIRKEKPHVVMLYNDMGVVTRFLEEIRKSGIPRDFKIWIYVDQVYNTQMQAFIDIINRDSDRVFAFTNYWKKCIKDQGVNRPIDVLGHGFENDVFKPMGRSEARKKANIPEEPFVIVNLNRNQPRKRYDILMMAFAELVVKYPTKPIFLLCVCDKGEKGGWWIYELFQRELKMRGVNPEQFMQRLLLSSQEMNYRDEDINVFYNLADVGINTADGEGWGLCNFEQMGVGIPQVVPDIGGFKEFCNSENSMLVKPKYRYHLPIVHSPVGGEAEAVDPHDVCLAIEEYLMDSTKREAHGKKARETVLTYTWERATQSLVRRLKQEKEDFEEENKQ